jgi:hypothetical protein
VFEFDDLGHRMRYRGGALVSDEEVELTDLWWITLEEK